jgi:hypothetical protein
MPVWRRIRTCSVANLAALYWWLGAAGREGRWSSSVTLKRAIWWRLLQSSFTFLKPVFFQRAHFSYNVEWCVKVPFFGQETQLYRQVWYTCVSGTSELFASDRCRTQNIFSNNTVYQCLENCDALLFWERCSPWFCGSVSRFNRPIFVYDAAVTVGNCSHSTNGSPWLNAVSVAPEMIRFRFHVTETGNIRYFIRTVCSSVVRTLRDIN